MIDGYDKLIAARDFLRSNFQDPISRMGQWIHDDTLDEGLENARSGKTPKVYMEQVPSTLGFLPAGTGEPEDFILADVHTIVKTKDVGRVDGGMIRSDKRLLFKIAQKIDYLLLHNSTSITGINWILRFSMGGTLRPSGFKITTWRYIIH